MAGAVLLSGEVPRNQWAERSCESCGRGSDSHHPMAMAVKERQCYLNMIHVMSNVVRMFYKVKASTFSSMSVEESERSPHHAYFD